MAQKQVFDLQPATGMPIALSNEELRIAKNGAYENLKTVNFDPTREHLNFEVTKGGVITPVNKSLSITRRIRDSLRKRNIQDPNAGKDNPSRRTVANIILGGSRERMLEMAFGKQVIEHGKGADNSHVQRQQDIEKWAVDMYNFMSRKFGEENIASFIVHLDETNPHVHCTLLPVTERNKLSWKQVFHGYSKEETSDFMKELHNELSEINRKYDLKRGDPIAQTGAKHRTTEAYREDLDKEVLQKKEDLYAINREIKLAERRVKGLSSMIDNLLVKKAELEDQISSLLSQVQNGTITAAEMQAKVTELQTEISNIKKKIEERKEQLNKAELQLEEALRQRNAVRQQAENIRKELKKAIPNLEKKTIREVQTSYWEMLAKDIIERSAAMDDYIEHADPERKEELQKFRTEVFADTIFESTAEHAAEITAVATALFLGYIDQATAIAQSCGGGGGPSGGWGRDRDDDDDSWRRKCLFMGMRMIAPNGRQIKR